MRQRSRSLLLSRLIPIALLLAVVTPPSRGQNNSRHVEPGGDRTVETLEQNWSDDESNWFYNVPQGSRFLPYEWFLHLELAGSERKFRDADHIRSLGYIPRKADSSGNKDGLPIGFTKDAEYPGGNSGLGLTCAACHTSQINFGETAFLIDGGPTMGDFEGLMRGIASSLNATADDDDKFRRFAKAVLPDAGPEDRRELRVAIRRVARTRSSYNSRNLPAAADGIPFGHGRVDAFGAIFNEVSATFLRIPTNAAKADAPVSYPCLWDAPQHNKVQWNGAAENRSNSLGELLFGTDEVGALGRNAGEVIGVFGSVTVNDGELFLPRRYPSTVKKTNLINIEDKLKTLWSPEWPVAKLGAIDAKKRAAGKRIYETHCVSCHAIIDRDSADRKVEAVLENVGTDMQMIRNFGRVAKTGRLKGRRKTLLGVDRFSSEEPIGVILKHVVERTILKPDLNPQSIATALKDRKRLANRHDDTINSLNPGYQMTATIETNDQRLHGQFDLLEQSDEFLDVRGGLFKIFDKGQQTASATDEVLDLGNRAAVKAARKLGALVAGKDPQVARLNNATAKIGYKARPLNGIWATAPYFHNGSVRTLLEVLKPASGRSETFHVGSMEFDPIDVGFRNDHRMPVFDTTLRGNSKAGHEYGADLSGEDRQNLLEFLKSL